MKPGSLLVCALSLSAPAAAQQFVLQPGAIPGTPRWSEGVEAADVENDGDLDLFFADGEGFASAGTERQNALVINRLEVAGGFADESVARLGAHTSNAKMVITGDIQDDGLIDALFCNAFFTDPPFLYVNQAATPGFFGFEGAARGLTTAYSSGGGQFGDVDADGDLDLLLADGYLGSSARRPHLFRNDGTGHFAEDAAFTAAAPAKSAQMDVQLVDLEGDLDLDFVGICRAENGSAGAGDHYVMLNDGTGAFTDQSELLPDGSSGSVYEGELGDFDGDRDLDLFLISISGFADGPVQNGFAPSGPLSFQLGTGIGGDDDNEVLLYDFDGDGDYDPFVGSLGSGGEKAYVNGGAGAFTLDGALVQGVSDSTLDMTACDLDNDGAYDLVTAQGESNSAQWENKVYRNTGIVDRQPPVVLLEEALPASGPGGTWVVRAEERDQVQDDGQDWVRGAVRYVVLAAPQAEALDATAGGFSQALASVAAGTTVTWTNQDTAPHSIVSGTAGYVFDSGPLAQGETFSYTFVTPGLYDYGDRVGGLGNAQVDVTGAASVGHAQRSGGGIHRFTMTDTLAGAGVALAWEIAFTDWAGNTTVAAGHVVDLARAVFRNGGANPASLSAAAPVLGTTVAAEVDLGTTGHSLAILFAFDAPIAVTLAGGQTLLAIDLGGSGELLGQSAVAGPLAGFPLPIPPDPSLAGFTAHCQAIHFGGITPYALSNAQDLVLGF